MKPDNKIALMIIIFLICSSFCLADPINTPEQAFERAIEYCGFNVIEGFDTIYSEESDVATVLYIDSTTPNLHEQLNGVAAWKVSYPEFEVVLCSLSNCDGLIASPLTCDVWLDSTTGQLLLVDIRQSDSTVLLRRPSEENLSEAVSVRFGSYVGLPDVIPNFGMLNAIAQCENFVVYADETIIQYIMVMRGEETSPFWIVYMMGVGYAKRPYNALPGESFDSNSFLIMNALTGYAPPLLTVKIPIPIE